MIFYRRRPYFFIDFIKFHMEIPLFICQRDKYWWLFWNGTYDILWTQMVILFIYLVLLLLKTEVEVVGVKSGTMKGGAQENITPLRIISLVLSS